MAILVIGLNGAITPHDYWTMPTDEIRALQLELARQARKKGR